MSGGGGGPSQKELQDLQDEKARQSELRRQAELARLGRGRRLASIVGDEFYTTSTILGGAPKFAAQMGRMTSPGGP